MNGLRASINTKIAELKGGAPAPAPATPAPAPAPAPAAPAGPTCKTYGLGQMHWIIERGDTLSKIARHYYGDAKYVDQIAAYNGTGKNAPLKVGDRIWVSGPIVWTVEAPDEIRTIAAYYGVDPMWSVDSNRRYGITGPDSQILIGWNLTIL